MRFSNEILGASTSQIRFLLTSITRLRRNKGSEPGRARSRQRREQPAKPETKAVATLVAVLVSVLVVFMAAGVVLVPVSVLVVAVIAATPTAMVVAQSRFVGGESPGIIVILCKCNGFRL